ncbi:MAG: hypothetical protein RLZZ628_99 [Bacteroidota bacterium]|jgi:RHS repeat-associated protein
MKKALFLSLTMLLWGVSTLVQGQTPSFAAPSPSTGQSNHSVSQYSGGLGVGIPLVNLSARNTVAPVSLNYTAGNGVRVNQLSSAVGLGWNLSAGGMITRQVNDMPDDCKDLMTVNAQGRSVVGTDNVGYLYRLGQLNPIDYLVAKDLKDLTYTDRNHVFTARVDKEPDLFSFNFNGHSGTFVFDKDGVIRTHAKSDLEITYVLSPNESPYTEHPNVFPNQTTYRGAITEFTIKTSDGFTYRFTQKEVTFVHETTQTSENMNEVSTDCAPKIKDPYKKELNYAGAIYTGWHLTSISSPYNYNLEARFAYQNELYMEHSSIRQTCAKTAKVTVSTSGDEDQGYSYTTNCTDKIINTFSASAISYIKPRLVEISSIDGRLEFDYNVLYSNRFDINNTYYDVIDRARRSPAEKQYYPANKLENIKVKDNNGQLLKTIRFEYDLVNGGSMPCNNSPHHYRHQLLSIKEVYSGNEILLYKFDYDGTPLPPRHSAQVDNWGYYNGSSATNFLRAAKAYPTDPMNSDAKTIYSTYPRPNGGTPVELPANAGTPNLQFTKAGILTKMTNVLGGSTAFEYESNQYLAIGSTVPQSGAGVRIKKITLDDKNGNQSATQYFYDENGNGTGVTTGRLIEVPILHRLNNEYNYYSQGDSNCPGMMDNDGNQLMDYVSCMKQACPMPLNAIARVPKLTIYYSPAYWSGSATSGYVVPIGYRKVTEQTVNGRVESVFNLDTYVGSTGTNYWNNPVLSKPATSQWGEAPPFIDNFPYPSNPNYDWSRSLLLSQSIYNANGLLLKKVENTYQLVSATKVNAIKTLSRHSAEFGGMFNWGKYYHNIVDVRLQKVTTKEYSDATNWMVSEVNYTYNNTHPYPIAIKTKNSDNVEYETKYFYPQDLGDPILIAQRRLKQPLRTEMYANGGIIGGAKTIFGNFTVPAYDISTGDPIQAEMYASKYQQIWEANTWKTVATIQSLDMYGNVLTELNNLKNTVTQYEYNEATSRLVLSKTVFKANSGIALGFKESYEYDNLNRLITTTHPDGQKTRYVYDAFHRVVEVSDRNGAIKTKTEYSIDPNTLSNNFTKSYSVFGNEVTPAIYKYADGMGRPIKEVLQGYTPRRQDLVTNSTVYDDLNAQVRSFSPISALAAVTQYEKSPLQRVLSTTAPGWSRSVYSSYAFNTATDVPGYNANTLYKVQVTDENGNIALQFKDKIGKTILSRQLSGNTNVDTRYYYNIQGKLIEVAVPGSGGTGSALNYRYVYDAKNLLVSKYVPQKGISTYTYDANYRMDKETMPDGTVLQYVYDEYDQQKEVWNITNAANNFKLHEFEYFPNTNTNTVIKLKLKKKKTLILGSSPLTYLQTDYTYDGFGRTAQEVVQHHKTGNDTYVYTYDSRDRVSSVVRTHTNGAITTTLAKRFTYDHANRLLAVYLKRNTDNEMQLNGLTYNEADQLIAKKLGIRGTALQELNYTYNDRGWLKGINTVQQGNCSCTAVNAAGYDVPLSYQGSAKISYSRSAFSTTMLLINIQLENKGYLNGVLKTTDTKTIQVTGTLAKGRPIPAQEVIAMNGVARWSTVASILASGIYTKVQVATSYSQLFFDEQSLLTLLKNGICEAAPESQLFGMELHYDDGNADLNAPAQYNGNISWMKWRVNTNSTRSSQAYGFQYDNLNRLTKATYGEYLLDKACVVNKNRYDETITYSDTRGNISNIQRNGLLANGSYGAIDNIVMTYLGNRLNTISELSDRTKGFTGGSGSVTYDNRGNMTADPSRGITVTYNFLDLPTLISVSGRGNISFVYDASGNLLTKTVNANAQAALKTDYVKGIEYVNNVMTSIYHEEGRLLNVNGLWLSEYGIKDHLGNTRVTFRDINNDSKITANEVTQEAHYYPFGMQMEGIWSPTASPQIPYLYNGIEKIGDLGLNINAALFRTLDPALGRWWQIDPKAEALISSSPYNAMNNNPASISDPNGDIAPVVIAAIIGAVVNVAANWNNINNFWDGLGYAAIGAAAGAISGGVAAGVSSAYLGTSSAVAGFSSFMSGGSAAVAVGANAGALMGAASGFTAGMITGGGNAAMQGGNIGNGMWKGAWQGALIGGGTGFLTGGFAALGKGLDFMTGDKIVKHMLPGVSESTQLSGFSAGKPHCNIHCCKSIAQATGKMDFDIEALIKSGVIKVSDKGTNLGQVLKALGYSESSFSHITNSLGLNPYTDYFGQALADSGAKAVILSSETHSVVLEGVVERFSQRTGELISRYSLVMDPNYGSGRVFTFSAFGGYMTVFR